MQRKLLTLSPDMAALDAVALLLKHKRSGAPVVDEDRRLLGILFDADCLGHVTHCAVNRQPTGRVAEIMKPATHTITPTTNALTIAHIFSTTTIRRLPVVEESGKVVGQVSRTDLLAAFFEMMTDKKRVAPEMLYLSALGERSEPPAEIR